MAVIGLDLSLTSTGMALVEGGQILQVANIKSKGKRKMTYDEQHARIRKVYSEITDVFYEWSNRHLELAVIEAPSHGSQFGNPHERAGLWWKVYGLIHAWGVPIATIAPATRAKFITGNGRADKTEVLSAARERWGEIKNHDIADAVGLAMWGEENAA